MVDGCDAGKRSGMGEGILRPVGGGGFVGGVSTRRALGRLYSFRLSYVLSGQGLRSAL